MKYFLVLCISIGLIATTFSSPAEKKGKKDVKLGDMIDDRDDNDNKKQGENKQKGGNDDKDGDDDKDSDEDKDGNEDKDGDKDKDGDDDKDGDKDKDNDGEKHGDKDGKKKKTGIGKTIKKVGIIVDHLLKSINKLIAKVLKIGQELIKNLLNAAADGADDLFSKLGKALKALKLDKLLGGMVSKITKTLTFVVKGLGHKVGGIVKLVVKLITVILKDVVLVVKGLLKILI